MNTIVQQSYKLKFAFHKGFFDDYREITIVADNIVQAIEVANIFRNQAEGREGEDMIDCEPCGVECLGMVVIHVA